MKRLLAGTAAVLAVLGGYVAFQVTSFDASMEREYAVPLPAVAQSVDMARGEHLAKSVAGCALDACHGSDLAGGKPLVMGPLGTFTAPNITRTIDGYSDAELLRLMRTGIRKDNRSVRFMPVSDFQWLPDDDMAAIVAWLRTVPKSDRASAEVHVGTLGKLADRHGRIAIDIARRNRAAPPVIGTPPAPDAAYGRHLAQLCVGCHGEDLRGGPKPGMPPPANLTSLEAWTYDDFARMAETGAAPDGRKLDPAMPTQAIANMNETERRALWAYLRSQATARSGI